VECMDMVINLLAPKPGSLWDLQATEFAAA